MGHNSYLLKREIDQFTLDGKFIKTHESIKKAVEETKINSASICLACRGKYTKAGGFIWKYNNKNIKPKLDPLDKIVFNPELEDEEDDY